MRCTDCICYEVCGYHIDEETTMTVNECSTSFKNKNQYVKLPVYIGQEVWMPFQYFDGSVEILEGKVSMIQQKADKSWKFRVSRNGSVADYAEDEIDTRVFFTKAAAKEKAERLERYHV